MKNRMANQVLMAHMQAHLGMKYKQQVENLSKKRLGEHITMFA